MQAISESTAAKVQSAIEREFGALVINKDNEIIEKISTFVFDMPRQFGVKMISSADFLDNYGTTIAKVIMLPRRALTPLERTYLMVHEGGHVGQFNEHNVKFMYQYLAYSEARAAFEAACIAQEAALTLALTGQINTEMARTDMLANGYLLSDEDVRFARDLVLQQANMITSGYVQPVDGKKSTAIVAIQTIAREQPEALLPGVLDRFKASGLVY